MTEVKRVFKVNGKPFFPIGAQSCNSSGYNEKEAETAFKVIKELHGNTLEIPVYWEKVEPEEGKFDFTAVDSLLASARRQNIKLILLWFASWKNGNMDYTPAWVKNNTKRFKKIISPAGKHIWDLSPHCEANREADKKAFVALCKHLKAKDSAEQTVIALQIENEQGLLGSDRDYGPEAQVIFDSIVPAKLMAAMKKAGKGRVYDIWQQAGQKSGSWPQVFGPEAGELMTAWSLANYVEDIAAAAKKVYDLPMYINVWMMEQNWWSRPGESYPAGGAVTKVLDIYKWFTPHLDLIAPDNYQLDSKAFEAVCANYLRNDNPLFMPETIGDKNMFRAIADYNSLGNFFFGAEYMLDANGAVRPECQPLVNNVRATAAVIPLLLKYQGTGKIHAVIQEEHLFTEILDLDGFEGLIEYGDKFNLGNGTDWRHAGASWLGNPSTTRPVPACGLVIQVSKNEFYLVGSKYRLFLRPKLTMENLKPHLLFSIGTAKNYAFIDSVEEGHFDKNGKFTADRQRNGDEIWHRGLWVESDIGVLKVITSEFQD